jgi:hypothetical protein
MDTDALHQRFDALPAARDIAAGRQSLEHGHDAEGWEMDIFQCAARFMNCPAARRN